MKNSIGAITWIVALSALAVLAGGCCAQKCTSDPWPKELLRKQTLEQAKQEMVKSEQYNDLQAGLKEVNGRDMDEARKKERKERFCKLFHETSIRNRFCNQAGGAWSKETECCQDSDCTAGCATLKERYVDKCAEELFSEVKECSSAAPASARPPTD